MAKVWCIKTSSNSCLMKTDYFYIQHGGFLLYHQYEKHVISGLCIYIAPAPPLSLCLSLRCRVNISLSTAWYFSIHSLSNCKYPLLSSTQGIYYLHYSYLSNVYLCTSDDNVHWSITMAGSMVTLDFPMLHDYKANQPSGKHSLHDYITTAICLTPTCPKMYLV